MKLVNVKSRGQGLVEYGLIMTLVALVVMIVLTLFGPQVSGVYDTVLGALNLEDSVIAQAAQTLYETDFEDMDDWTREKFWFFNGKCKAKNGAAECNNAAFYFLGGQEVSDGTISVSGLSVTNNKHVWNGAGIMFRADEDTRSGYIFEMEENSNGPAYGLPESYFVFRKWVNGTQISTPIAVTAVPDDFEYSEASDIQIVTEGDTFQAYVDGVMVLEGQDDMFDSGTVGMVTNWGSKMTVDGLTITD